MLPHMRESMQYIVYISSGIVPRRRAPISTRIKPAWTFHPAAQVPYQRYSIRVLYTTNSSIRISPIVVKMLQLHWKQCLNIYRTCFDLELAWKPRVIYIPRKMLQAVFSPYIDHRMPLISFDRFGNAVWNRQGCFSFWIKKGRHKYYFFFTVVNRTERRNRNFGWLSREIGQVQLLLFLFFPFAFGPHLRPIT